MRGRTIGNRRAAHGQRDTSTVVINVQKTFQVPIPANTTSNVILINMWQQLVEANMFQAYRGMYDQVKLNGISARLRGLNGSTALTNANTPTICTAWDRNGLEPTNAAETQSVMSYQTATSYSSAIISNWSPGNAFRMIRRIYPSTIAEKSYYASTGCFTVDDVSRNPAIDPLYHVGTGFKPILLIGAYTGFTTNAQQSIGFMVEFDITCTFRGLRRYSLTADAAETQISAMAGKFTNGATGDLETASAATSWTAVNNDGFPQSSEAPTAPIKAEPL